MLESELAMKKLIFGFIVNFLTVDNICFCIGFLLSRLLLWARKLDNWDLFKAIISKIRGWLDILDQVIEDDTLTEDEEKLIIEALKNTRAINKINDIRESIEVKNENN